MDSHAPLLAQLDDSQLDEQVCLTFDAVRQRLFARNATIFSMQQNYGRERNGLSRQIRTLEEELAVERRENEKLRSHEDIITSRLRGEQGCKQGFEQVPEQSSTDHCHTQPETIETEWQPEQSIEATTLRYRRLGRAALVSSVTVDTQRRTTPPQASVESVESGCGLDQRKRAKRSQRKETPFEASNNATASR